MAAAARCAAVAGVAAAATSSPLLGSSGPLQQQRQQQSSLQQQRQQHLGDQRRRRRPPLAPPRAAAGAVATAASDSAGAAAAQAAALSLRSFLLGVAAVVAAQLLARWLLRQAWARAAVDRVFEWLRLPAVGWPAGGSNSDDAASEGIPGGPYGWDDEVYSRDPSGDGDGDGAAASSSSSGYSRTTTSSSSGGGATWLSPKGERARRREHDIAARMLAGDEGESVEWVNMCIRKSWRVFQRGLERWFTDLLQPVFDGLLEVGPPPLLRWGGVELGAVGPSCCLVFNTTTTTAIDHLPPPSLSHPS